MDYIEILEKVNQLDNGIDECEKILKEIPGYLDKIDLGLKKVDDEIQDRRDEFKRLLLKKKDMENELKAWEEKIEKLRNSADIKSYKSYMATLKEIQNIKAENDRREEEILYYMEEIETKEKELEEVGKRLSGERKRLEEERGRLAAKIPVHQKRCEQLKREREEFVHAADRRLLAGYQRVRERYQGNVVSLIKGGICSECNMLVPPQIVNEVIGGTLHQCPTCSRFLCRVEGY